MASRSLNDLAEPVQLAAERLLAQASRDGLELLVYCTLRSNAEQDYIYESGRTKPGAILTNARGGQSMHNPDKWGKAWAFDVVPMLGGKPAWKDDLLLEWMGVTGERCGLIWAGRWRGKLREKVHFEMRRG